MFGDIKMIKLVWTYSQLFL